MNSIRISFAKRLRPVRFLRNECGAVTVDWVVLTAAIVLLGVAAGFYVGTGSTELAGKIDDTIDVMTVTPQ